ncbi:MAG: DUF362 domain-containing protein [Deltaproteobacteria bacterium]|nr:MAG: DUF362 domain-containing protein [Deltaproteobacteria bacterium]
MKLPVSLQPLADYQPERVRAALVELLAPLGGMAAFVRPGQKVLLKPNLLAGKPPEKAVTTHPEVVRQVILLVQEAGGVVSVGDSPGIGHPEAVARKCGILAAVEATGARFAPFIDSVPVKVQEGTFHHLEVAREVLDADVIINLPKLKTHQMMGFTGAVKNMFGAVVGMRKVRLHLQAGADPAFFALMLLELAERFPPALTIMDAVVGMEGNGPGSGDPVPIGALLASPHALALDTAAIALVGLNERQVWTQRVATESGRAGSRLAEIDLLGPELAGLRPKRFRPAPNSDIGFGLPAPVKRALRNTVTARPEIAAGCVRCGDCVRHCPPHAMTLDRHGVQIDYHRCIRCFCCQELCPHGAILTRQGALLRIAAFFGGKR